MFADIPARTRSELVRAVGHESHLLGLHLEHQLHEFRRGVALDVKLGLDERTQTIDVVTPDVALVGAGMDCDAVGAESLTVGSHLEKVGDILAARVAQGGYLVDIYAEICHFSLR